MKRQKSRRPFGRTSGRPQGESQRFESNSISETDQRGEVGRRSRALQVARMFHIFVFFLMFLSAGVCLAQDHTSSNIATTDDCTKILLNFQDDPNLTRQEKTKLMDKALLDSLNKYERCQNTHSGHSSASGGNGSHAGDAGKGQQASSTASSGMTGTNAPVDKQSSTGSRAGTGRPPINVDVHGRTKAMHGSGNGKIPDDIPPVNNDSVLAGQIRQAAINETDPVIKEKLWNEYRKYKGLPVVNKQ